MSTARHITESFREKKAEPRGESSRAIRLKDETRLHFWLAVILLLMLAVSAFGIVYAYRAKDHGVRGRISNNSNATNLTIQKGEVQK